MKEKVMPTLNDVLARRALEETARISASLPNFVVAIHRIRDIGHFRRADIRSV